MRPIALSAAVCIAAIAAALAAAPALAEDSAPPVRQASRHFQRGVTLYGEADYRAALVEFKRAYALAPNPAVLYNVGETQYQLQDYAGALTTFEHYLAESGPGDAHRAEVEGNLEVLRARVGHVSVVTSPPGADVTVDDQPVGKTPTERPLLVSVGHRKIVASLPGRPPTTRYVDVAADDNVGVTIAFPDLPEPAAPASPRIDQPARPPDAPARQDGSTLRVLGWTATGVLAAGAVTFGVLAIGESTALKNLRASFPTSSETLDRAASSTTTYSMVADALTVSAIVIGGITLGSSLLSSSPSSGPQRGSAGTTHVVLGPASVRLDMTF
jgi:hypothetical protein